MAKATEKRAKGITLAWGCAVRIAQCAPGPVQCAPGHVQCAPGPVKCAPGYVQYAPGHVRVHLDTCMCTLTSPLPFFIPIPVCLSAYFLPYSNIPLNGVCLSCLHILGWDTNITNITNIPVVRSGQGFMDTFSPRLGKSKRPPYLGLLNM